ncbi:MAG: patatin-like phospholipase family protein [Bacteroidales bacterium]|nr:patatin-like phospholipase family protein [Bacteroidales bacterium]
MDKDVALVLSSGGARGMAHIGVIEELESRGYTIRSIAGSSMGAIVGGIYASGNLEEFKKWLLGMGKLDIVKLMDFAINRKGMIKGEKVFNEIAKFISSSNIEDLSIPFVAVATDIRNQEEVVFRNGKLLTALRASSAIPSFILPLKYKGLDLVDGGILNPFPINHAIRNENEKVVAVNVNAHIPYEVPPIKDLKREKTGNYLKAISMINEKWTQFFNNNNLQHKKEYHEEEDQHSKPLGFFDIITNSFATMQYRLAQIAIKNYKPDVLVNVSRYSCELLEFYRSQELIEAGRIATRKALDKEEKKLSA